MSFGPDYPPAGIPGRRPRSCIRAFLNPQGGSDDGLEYGDPWGKNRRQTTATSTPRMSAGLPMCHPTKPGGAHSHRFEGDGGFPGAPTAAAPGGGREGEEIDFFRCGNLKDIPTRGGDRIGNGCVGAALRMGARPGDGGGAAYHIGELRRKPVNAAAAGGGGGGGAPEGSRRKGKKKRGGGRHG